MPGADEESGLKKRSFKERKGKQGCQSGGWRPHTRRHSLSFQRKALDELVESAMESARSLEAAPSSWLAVETRG